VPTVASTPCSDTFVKAATKLPNVGFCSSAAGDAQVTEADTRGPFHNGATGLSSELCGISLSPSRHVELAEGNCDKVLSSTPVKEVKHCLDFDDSDSGIRSPEMQCKCVCVRDESNVYKPTVDNCHKSPVVNAADSNKSCQRKNVVFHASMPISVPKTQKSQSDHDKFTKITPVTQRSHKFLVCGFFILTVLYVDLIPGVWMCVCVCTCACFVRLHMFICICMRFGILGCIAALHT